MDVLIIEDENHLREALLDGLSRAIDGLSVLGAPSIEHAERAIEDYGWPQLVVSDIRLPGRSGIDFLMGLRERKAKAKVILISAFASQDAIEQVHHGGALRFLSKPFELNDLVESVRMALELQEFSGNADSITFLDVLQILHMGKKSASMRLRHGNRVGHICLEDGEVVHADCGELHGEAAFNALVEWRSPAFKVHSDPPKASHTVGTPFGFLLMEATRLVDEARRDEPGADSEKSTPKRVLQQTEVDGMDPSTACTTEEEPMQSMKDMCKELVDDTPDAVASNIVDLNTGMMLAGHFVSSFTTDHFEAVSAAVTSLFRGKETLRVEKLVKAQRGDGTDDHYMQQVHLSTTNLEHFVVKIPDREAVLTLVTRSPGNIGMGWAAVRSAAPQAVEMIPS